MINVATIRSRIRMIKSMGRLDRQWAIPLLMQDTLKAIAEGILEPKDAAELAKEALVVTKLVEDDF